MLYHLVSSFYYAVGLGIVGRRQPPSDLKQFADPFPYVADELGASVGDDR
jgi:hypothetical protein